MTAWYEIEWGTILVLLSMTINMLYVVDIIFFKKRREAVKERNEKLDKIRSIPVKTLAEQKEFIDMRYGNFDGKFMITWKMVWYFLVGTAKFIAIFMLLNFLITAMNIHINLFWGIIIAILIPILINIILKVFGFEQQNNFLNVIR